MSIQSYFASEQFSPADIVKWVQWFCGALGGPIVYETPIPKDGIWERKHASYEVCSYYFRFLHALTNFFKKPHGFLKSKFIIDVSSHFLQEIKDSAFDFRPPRGLFVLILTAVSALHSMHRYFLMKPMKYERVVRSYKTGIYAPIGDFSAKWCNKWVRQYDQNFNNKMDSWWNDLLEHYNVTEVGHIKDVDMSMLDEGRGALPMSSP